MSERGSRSPSTPAMTSSNLYSIIEIFNAHFLSGTVNSVGRFCVHLVTMQLVLKVRTYIT